MNNILEKKAGISLIVFCFLLTITMVLHPAGGSFEYMVRITTMVIVTHSIAIFSLPVGWFGFWGLTHKIGAGHPGSLLGFAMISLGLVAALLAAATNGLVLPFYIQHYKEATPDSIAAIRPILYYGSAINLAFDYIYTGAFCLAVLCWSTTILVTKKLPAWIGWSGILISLAAAAIFISGVAVNSLHGLRIFGGCMIIWILLTGIVLYKQR